MESLEFSVPYNGNLSLSPELFSLKGFGGNKIREIYLSGPQDYSGSGRIMPIVQNQEFYDVIEMTHKEGIRVNVILNSTCEGSEWYSDKVVSSTMEYLKRIHEEHGVESVTIANPLYIQEVRRILPNIEICASVLGNIDCVQRAVLYKKMGADVITPDVNINRNLGLLKEIKETTNLELKIMVNEGCLYKCPFRSFHFNATSHVSRDVSKDGLDFSFAKFFDSCNKVIKDDLSQILKSCWIRPEDIRKYIGITRFFKIVGRSQVNNKIIRACKAYLGENWDGDLLDILCASIGRFSARYGACLHNKALEQYRFFETVTSYNHDCNDCDYCNKLSKRLINLGVYTFEKAEDLLPQYIEEKVKKAY